MLNNKLVSNSEILKKVTQKICYKFQKYQKKIKLFRETQFVQVCLKNSLRFFMDLSVSTLSGKFANNPKILKTI